MLAAAGVLKFVDEQVADTVGNRQRRFAGNASIAFENMQGDLSYFNEVDGACFGKDGAQFACRVAQ